MFTAVEFAFRGVQLRRLKPRRSGQAGRLVAPLSTVKKRLPIHPQVSATSQPI